MYVTSEMADNLPPILRLPVEVRLQIFRPLLVTETPIRLDTALAANVPAKPELGFTGLALLRVNKVLAAEAADLLYGANNFELLTEASSLPRTLTLMGRLSDEACLRLRKLTINHTMRPWFSVEDDVPQWGRGFPESNMNQAVWKPTLNNLNLKIGIEVPCCPTMWNIGEANMERVLALLDRRVQNTGVQSGNMISTFITNSVDRKLQIVFDTCDHGQKCREKAELCAGIESRLLAIWVNSVESSWSVVA